MFRNSIFYRRWWYVRKRNIKRMNLLLRLAIAALFIWLLYYLSMNLHSILPEYVFRGL